MNTVNKRILYLIRWSSSTIKRFWWRSSLCRRGQAGEKPIACIYYWRVYEFPTYLLHVCPTSVSYIFWNQFNFKWTHGCIIFNDSTYMNFSGRNGASVPHVPLPEKLQLHWNAHTKANEFGEVSFEHVKFARPSLFDCWRNSFVQVL